MDHNRLKKLMNAASMALFVLCVALGIWLWRKGVFQSKEALQDFLTNYGGSATTLFLVLQAVQVVIPILPGGVSCLAGVLLFGPWLGFVLNYVGISLGSFVAFAMARNWGKPLLNKLFSKKLFPDSVRPQISGMGKLRFGIRRLPRSRNPYHNVDGLHILSSSVISRTTRHGFPTASTWAGISFVTTLPAPITLPSPMVTPGRIVTFAPSQTLSPTVIGFAISSP